MFVLLRETALAGVAVTSRAEEVSSGPPAVSLAAARQALPEMSPGRFFMYGPVAVACACQWHGLVTRLFLRARAELRDRFSLGVAFVEPTNQKSLAVHRRYPMLEIARFSIRERHYTIFTFSPAHVLKYYGATGAPRGRVP